LGKKNAPETRTGQPLGNKAKRGGRRDLAATRKRILEAASREFAWKGLDGARIDKIAARSRSNKAMIYYIFGNKEALHLAVLENLFEEKTKNLDAELLVKAPSLEELRLMLSSYFDAFLDNPDATRILFHDLSAGSRTLKRLKGKRPDLFQPFSNISGRLKKLGRQGQVRSLDPDKGVLAAMLLLMALPVILPHADLIHAPGGVAHRNLTNPEKWKRFLADVLFRVLKE
jgi:TetR/AcrR family transcriptional regulator